jgi:hypothetical protein
MTIRIVFNKKEVGYVFLKFLNYEFSDVEDNDNWGCPKELDIIDKYVWLNECRRLISYVYRKNKKIACCSFSIGIGDHGKSFLLTLLFVVCDIKI